MKNPIASRLLAICLLSAAATVSAAETNFFSIADGPFKPDWNSLTNYQKFNDMTNPPDKSPFPSGDSIQYTPTLSLTSGTTYWHGYVPIWN